MIMPIPSWTAARSVLPVASSSPTVCPKSPTGTPMSVMSTSDPGTTKRNKPIAQTSITPLHPDAMPTMDLKPQKPLPGD